MSDRIQRLRTEFEALTLTWNEETKFFSSTSQISSHPAYQSIIGMGPVAIPWILRELKKGPDHWFHALKAITGADPVAPADCGNVRKMTDAWLSWGRERYLIE